MKEALTTTQPNVKNSIVGAIQSGEMLVLRSVQHELNAAYPNLWPIFVAIKPKKYVDANVAISAVATELQESHGSSLLGGRPEFVNFEAVALARSKGCKLVTSGKALSECKTIVKRCGIPADDIVDVGGI